jgi:hypothetical protein
MRLIYGLWPYYLMITELFLRVHFFSSCFQMKSCLLVSVEDGKVTSGPRIVFWGSAYISNSTLVNVSLTWHENCWRLWLGLDVVGCTIRTWELHVNLRVIVDTSYEPNQLCLSQCGLEGTTLYVLGHPIGQWHNIVLNDIGKGKVLFSRKMDGAIFVSVTFTQIHSVGQLPTLRYKQGKNVSWNFKETKTPRRWPYCIFLFLKMVIYYDVRNVLFQLAIQRSKQN